MDTAPTRFVTLPGSVRWPALGIGTARMGEDPGRRAAEVTALRLAFELGYRVIDTAEMYGEGGAEEVVGEALAGAFASGLTREQFFIVSKVYPHNASVEGMRAACAASLRRLRLDHIDLYLLHWRGAVPLAETLRGFAELRAGGWIGRFGVSNFDVDDMEELVALPGGSDCAANQVYFSLAERGIEFALLPWQRARGLPVMAYSPIGMGALAGAKVPAALRRVAERHAATPAQVALAAVLAHDGVLAIPKAVQAQHLRDNWAAQRLALTADDRAELDRAFPPPRRKQPLAMT